MTFEQFQATRQWSDDLTQAPGLDLGYAGPAPGYLYEGGLHIFVHANAEPRTYELIIGNLQNYGETAEDLVDLERELYQWGADEGLLA